MIVPGLDASASSDEDIVEYPCIDKPAAVSFDLSRECRKIEHMLASIDDDRKLSIAYMKCVHEEMKTVSRAFISHSMSLTQKQNYQSNQLNQLITLNGDILRVLETLGTDTCDPAFAKLKCRQLWFANFLSVLSVPAGYKQVVPSCKTIYVENNYDTMSNLSSPVIID